MRLMIVVLVLVGLLIIDALGGHDGSHVSLMMAQTVLSAS
jgi:hypothetical protein